MFERVLLPLDGSRLAEATLAQIPQILKLGESDILLLRAAHPPMALTKAMGSPGTDDYRAEAKGYLERVQAQLAREGGSVRAFVEDGPAAEAILATAERENVTLIVMATHGRSGLSRWVFGSVTEKVIRASVVPLLVLRSFPMSEPSRTLSFERIVVPIAHFNFRIIPYVRDFARVFGSRAVLLHVSEPGEDAATRDRSREELAVVAQELESTGVLAEIREREGDAAQEILNCSWEESAGLIAIMTHGARGPSRWTLGSVTEKVIRSATTPTLIVRNL
jgi:nucleotide-binding universal stress UspA family protein